MEAASKAAQILAQMIGKLQKYGCWKKERKKVVIGEQHSEF